MQCPVRVNWLKLRNVPGRVRDLAEVIQRKEKKACRPFLILAASVVSQKFLYKGTDFFGPFSLEGNRRSMDLERLY
jgi:hypothetical protein